MGSSLVLDGPNLDGLRYECLSLCLNLSLAQRRSKQSHIFDHSESAECLLSIHGFMIDPLHFSSPAGILAAIIWIRAVGPLQAIVHWYKSFFELLEVLKTII